MLLVDDSETAEWLAQVAGRPENFDWDSDNQTKNRKHEVEQAEIYCPLTQIALLLTGIDARAIEPRRINPAFKPHLWGVVLVARRFIAESSGVLGLLPHPHVTNCRQRRSCPITSGGDQLS